MAHALSSKSARAYVRRAVLAVGRDDLVDAAQLVTSELIANAIAATREADNGPGTVAVGVYQFGRAFVIEVWDCSRVPPRMVDATTDDEGGRGLLLVGAVSSDWGFRWPVSGGKVVYAVVGTVL
ncbi:ATP-binding protein [Herbidospora mongoliensis]|uniref:ATP-binding protein n=1 Tax=Herbidospora mongoliensis TaxID=688067 RepID=UPI000835CBC2|nr:ATP-binding protein [Herbidospora mongoliensis]